MPGRTHVEDRDDEVDRAGQRGDAGDLQAERPEVDAVGRREDRVGVRLVHEPAAVGGAAEEPRRVEEDAAEQEAPEAEGVDPREGDVTGADLQRHEVVGEAGDHRHHEEEDHRGGVHREHLVVQLGAEERVVRLRPAGCGSAAPRCRRRGRRTAPRRRTSGRASCGRR